jgi:antitoxin ParD1/3/4
MRTNIEIDDHLMDSVLNSGLYKTKKEAVEAGLTLLKHRNAQLELLSLKGKVSFFDTEHESKPYIIKELPVSFVAEESIKPWS